MRLMMANAKGGAGKTTLAIGLAGEFANRGYSVKMIDTDNPAHLSTWMNDSKENDAFPDNIDVVQERTSEGVLNALEYSRENEVIILDTPGRDLTIVQNSIPKIDCIVSPVHVSKADLVGSSSVWRNLYENKSGTMTPMMLVLTRWALTDQHSNLIDTLHEYASTCKLPIAETIIMRRNCLIDVFSGAGTIQNYEKTKSKMDSILKSRKEFSNLTDEIITYVASVLEAA